MQQKSKTEENVEDLFDQKVNCILLEIRCPVRKSKPRCVCLSHKVNPAKFGIYAYWLLCLVTYTPISYLSILFGFGQDFIHLSFSWPLLSFFKLVIDRFILQYCTKFPRVTNVKM